MAQAAPHPGSDSENSDDLARLLGPLDILDPPPDPKRPPLPAGIERGKQLSIGGGIPSLSTEAGNLTSDPPRARNHRWIGTLHWTRHDGSRDTITLPLGESTHIDGLGTITLLSVEPDPIMSTRNMGGFYYIINLTLDPDVTLQH